MSFKSPDLIWLGMTVGLIWCLQFWRLFSKNVLVLSHQEERTSGIFKGSKLIIFFLGLIGWGYLSYSLMQPRIEKSFTPSNRLINDIILTIDVSRSMLAEDLKPNRLEVAKEQLRSFSRLRPTDRIGLIIFSEKVFTLLPLSTDPSLLDKVLGDITIGYLGSGTNIGDALGLSVARAMESPTKNKVIILLTDGVSNVGNLTPLQAAEEAKKNNIKVYTIGLGTVGDAKMPVGKTPFGTQYQLIPGGSIDYKTLKEIANMTGGKFFPAQSKGSLSTILNEIQKLEKTEIKIDRQVTYDEKYYEFFVIGFILIFLSEFLRRSLLREVV
jgi:Ca-activated chloride channel family protein